MATALGARQSGVRILTVTRYFFVLQTHTQPSIRRLVRDGENARPFIAEFKNEWSQVRTQNFSLGGGWLKGSAGPEAVVYFVFDFRNYVIKIMF
jgi:hypothetical protein